MAALATAPKTFNPVLVGDLASRAVVHRLNADLFRIERDTGELLPELAESSTRSDDGRRIQIRLRSDLKFSDGHPCDADDVVFSFQVYLDEEVASPQRQVLLFSDGPIAVRKIDPLTVEIELPAPYAEAERLFDGFAILPRHRLADIYARGGLAEAWSLSTPPEEIVGLGPFRLREARPGDRWVLERNPFYWKRDDESRPLPYLDELVFVLVPSDESRTLRFVAGELDVIDRLRPKDYAVLAGTVSPRYQVFDLGAGLDVIFLLFNLNPLSRESDPELAAKQQWFSRRGFRRAVQAAIDLEAVVELAFDGLATPLASHVAPGSRRWIHPGLEAPSRSLDRARRWLTESGFHWDARNRLRDDRNVPVELTVMASATAPQHVRIASIVQADLSEIGVTLNVAPLELGAFLDRLLSTLRYEAAILGLGGGSGGPASAMNLLMSSGTHHFWHLGQERPATSWEAEIDTLMQRQATTLSYDLRKHLYDRVQEIMASELPLVGLVSPNVLVGAKLGLGNLRPAVLPHHVLWNCEELFWLPKAS